tara:strand:- start:530 stop:1702 length:1173 start_codon:yes stop_codon:yes gene_type:complete
MKFAIVGSGYVGFSLAVLLSQAHSVLAIDNDVDVVDQINKNISPIDDNLIDDYLKNNNLNLSASTVGKKTFLESDYIIICVPTNFNPETNNFDTSIVDSVVKEILEVNKSATIIIKSTVPVGFTQSMRIKHSFENIYFSPEFLREGNALQDNLYPSRIIVGGNSTTAKKFGEILKDLSLKAEENIPLEFMGSEEAEAVKLFANTYLAMRIAYYNELDSYCELKGLNTESVIRGVGYDSRIGNYYNNPSFGYGGYCLPKDSQQLLKNYENIPNKLIKATVEANAVRKDFIANQIIKLKPNIVGIYRLVMKKNSVNFRDSAIQGIIERIQKSGIELIIYEPNVLDQFFLGVKIINNFDEFVRIADLIVANRLSKELNHVSNKVYSRDLFREN